jgi:sodium/hydrogen antiporter
MVLTAVFVVLVFLYSLVSRRLQPTVITAPMLFTAVGAATILLPEAARELVLDRKVLLLIAELGLVMLLFTDASRINRSLLKTGRSLPIRLLSIGMPLTIVLGAVSAVVVLSGLSWAEAGILAAILAPTDAGLGQVIVSSQRVPLRIRQSLNVEPASTTAWLFRSSCCSSCLPLLRRTLGPRVQCSPVSSANSLATAP